jgi:hypothetical protein
MNARTVSFSIFQAAENIPTSRDSLQERRRRGSRAYPHQALEDRPGRAWPIVAVPRGSTACPVAALKGWIEAAGITEGAVFRRVFNRKAQRVTDQRLHGRAIASIVKKGAARLGFDVQAFGAHSLRSGLVTSAVKRGVSLLKICDQTRHKSIEMLRTYCRDAELFVGNAAAGLL